jgi:protein SCO1/2
MPIKTRLLIIAAAAFAGLALAGIAFMVTKDGSSNTPGRLVAVTGDAFGGPFTLTNHMGESVTEQDFAGRHRLIYFGFTYCPAICPTELSKIAAALTQLGEQAAAVQPLFITVDPARDTPEKLKPYVAMFHPALIGLTGTEDQIKDVLKAYKIYAAKVDDPNLTEYTMDHSSFIYLIGPDDRLLHIFRMQDTAETMAAVTARWITQTAPQS